MSGARALTPSVLHHDLLGLSASDFVIREGFGWTTADPKDDTNLDKSQDIDLSVYHIPSLTGTVDDILDPYSNISYGHPPAKYQTINDIGQTIEISPNFEYSSNPNSRTTHSHDTDLSHQSSAIAFDHRVDLSTNTSHHDLDPYSNTARELPTYTSDFIHDERNNIPTSREFHHLFDPYSQTTCDVVAYSDLESEVPTNITDEDSRWSVEAIDHDAHSDTTRELSRFAKLCINVSHEQSDLRWSQQPTNPYSQTTFSDSLPHNDESLHSPSRV